MIGFAETELMRGTVQCPLYKEGDKAFTLGPSRDLSGRVESAFPLGSIVVPFRGSYLGPCKLIPKRIYYGAYGLSVEVRNLCRSLEASTSKVH